MAPVPLARRRKLRVHIGHTFARLTVESLGLPGYFICKCVCGTVKSIRADGVISGVVQSCGCWNSEGRIKNIQGQTFDRVLVVAQHADRVYKKVVNWECECVCGTRFVATSTSLLDGSVKSCGCLQREASSRAHTTHGEAKKATKEYNTFQSIKQRCYNPKNIAYALYGGAGVYVCAQWLDKATGFATFLKDMGRAPSPNHSIDRPKGSNEYGPRCKWSLPAEQSQNIRSNRLVTYNGETKPASYWARHFNIYYPTLIARLNAWTVEKALTTPAIRGFVDDETAARLKHTRQLFEAMWQRCTNLNNPSYPNYGGRGISVCDKWGTFEAFVADVGLAEHGMSPERPDTNDNYKPGNFEWLAKNLQGRNKRNTHWIEIGNERLTLIEAATRYGLNRTTLSNRINRLKWSVEKALSTPLNTSRKKVLGV